MIHYYKTATKYNDLLPSQPKNAEPNTQYNQTKEQVEKLKNQVMGVIEIVLQQMEEDHLFDQKMHEPDFIKRYPEGFYTRFDCLSTVLHQLAANKGLTDTSKGGMIHRWNAAVKSIFVDDNGKPLENINKATIEMVKQDSPEAIATRQTKPSKLIDKYNELFEV